MKYSAQVQHLLFSRPEASQPGCWRAWGGHTPCPWAHTSLMVTLGQPLDATDSPKAMLEHQILTGLSAEAFHCMWDSSALNHCSPKLLHPCSFSPFSITQNTI